MERIQWDDRFKSFGSVKFVYQEEEYQGRIDDQNQEIIFPMLTQNKLGSLWFRIPASSVQIRKFLH